MQGSQKINFLASTNKTKQASILKNKQITKMKTIRSFQPTPGI